MATVRFILTVLLISIFQLQNGVKTENVAENGLKRLFLELQEDMQNYKMAVDARMEFLEKENVLLSDRTDSLDKDKDSVEERLDYLEAVTMQIVPRTCAELFHSGVTESGHYLIDPDGNKIGDLPIHVFCNMSSGVTEVHHDSMDQLEVTPCGDPGCYSRNVNYNGTLQQIQALKDLSLGCKQYIQYDCQLSPLQMDGINYAWWTGPQGSSNYYWTGDYHVFNNHICTCGETDSCEQNDYECNCDAMVGGFVTDAGFVTYKDDLPVMELRFGHTEYDLERGLHTLGPLECWGSAPYTIGDSCSSLRIAGETVSGYYQIYNSIDGLDTVKCDMTLTNDDPDFQTSMTTNIMFDASGTGGVIIAPQDPLYFSNININNGDGFDEAYFTAPVAGVYYFSVHLYCGYVDCIVYLMRYNTNGGYPLTYSMSNIETTYDVINENTFNTVATLAMQVGDKVYVDLSKGQVMMGAPFHSHFIGYLLHRI